MICSTPELREDAANSETLLYNLCHTRLNKECLNLSIIIQKGRQILLVDNNKVHFESEQKRNQNLNLKIIKHVSDNLLGMAIDTIVTTATLLSCNI